MRMKNFLQMMAAVLLLAGCGSGSVNETIRIADGDTREGGARSLNGSIIVGVGSVIEGDVNSVNGDVDLDDEATTGDIKTVNGSIRLGSGAEAGDIDSVNGNLRTRRGARTGSVRLVNGNIDAEQGTVIGGELRFLNGAAELRGTQVAGNLITYGGKITLTDGSQAARNIMIKKPKGVFSVDQKPHVVIGPDSRVIGKIIAEREIRLFVHESAEIGGIEGADPEPFADRPGSVD